MKKRTKLIIKCCPSCRSAELLAFEGDFFCLECSWDSLKMSVDRGDMDNIFDSWSVAERKSESIQNNETKQSIELILDSNLEISNDGSAA